MSRKVALVIGWGSVKCAAALGLLRVLRREGIEVNLVVANGAGSIFGSLIALGYDVEEIVELNRRLWTHEVTATPNRLGILQILFPKIFKVGEYFNLRDDRLVNERLREALGESTFSDTKIPLFVSATDYRTGKQVVMSDGSIFETVRASVALPLVFPPMEKDGQLLSDGYLSDPMPIGIAVQEGADIILAMGFESNLMAERNSFSEYMLHLSGLMSNNLLRASYAFYNLAHHSEVFMIVPQFDDDIHMFDTHRVPEIIKVGEAEGERIMPELKLMMETT